jgi:hypothetical protein
VVLPSRSLSSRVDRAIFEKLALLDSDDSHRRALAVLAYVTADLTS